MHKFNGYTLTPAQLYSLVRSATGDYVLKVPQGSAIVKCFLVDQHLEPASLMQEHRWQRYGFNLVALTEFICM